MPEHRAGQYRAFDVGADPHQVVNGVSVADTHHVLFDDRALVEHFGDIVGGGADQFDTRSRARLYGAAPMKAGRNEWWMLINGQPTPEELRCEYLHVTG